MTKISVTFVTEGIESAVTRAKEAAGDKMVQVIGGAETIQQCLNAGLCDQLQVDIMPMFLGQGLRLFEHIDADAVKLERVSVDQTTPIRTSVIFKVTQTAPKK